MRIISKTINSICKRFGYELHKIKKNDLSQNLLLIKNLINKYEVDLILDVGANDGQFASEMIHIGYSKQIVSFEPLTQAHNVLMARSKKSENWIVCDQCAIGDYEGSIDINVAGNSQSSSILPMLESHSNAAPESIYTGKERVPIYTLDKVAEMYFKRSKSALLKIDTQGYEWQVLNGAGKIIQGVNVVLIELSLLPLYDGQHLWLEIIERLENEGFSLWGLNPMFSDPASCRLLQVDGVFCRKLT